MDYSNWNTPHFTDGSRLCIKMTAMGEEPVSYMYSGKDDLVSTGQVKGVFSGFYRIMDGF